MLRSRIDASGWLTVHVTPRAARDEVRLSDNMVQLRVTSPPSDGAANQAVVRLVATALDLPPSHVAVARGTGSRIKRLRIG